MCGVWAIAMAVALVPPIASASSVPIAFEGFDVVAYFPGFGPAVQGSPEFAYDMHTSDKDGRYYEARFLFSSAAHRDVFASDPWHYAPRYGGF